MPYSKTICNGSKRPCNCKVSSEIEWKSRPYRRGNRRPRSGKSRQNFWMKLIVQKLEAAVRWKLDDLKFNRFCLIHPCDGQTDRQADGFAIAHRALSILCCRALWIIQKTEQQICGWSSRLIVGLICGWSSRFIVGLICGWIVCILWPWAVARWIST